MVYVLGVNKPGNPSFNPYQANLFHARRIQATVPQTRLAGTSNAVIIPIHLQMQYICICT